MTEAEWLVSADPLPMHSHVFGPYERLSGEVYFCRKNLLLIAACFHRLEGLLPPHILRWSEHAELAADGFYEKMALHAEGEVADWEMQGILQAATTADARGRLRALIDAWMWTASRVWQQDESEVHMLAERKQQAELVRDLFGNPFRLCACDSSWSTSTVLALASGIYEEKAFDRMPILADALQDAGCENDAILDHCRGPGTHVRGCWVLDLLLSRNAN